MDDLQKSYLKGSRVRRVVITGELVLSMFKTGFINVAVDGLPKDSTVRGFNFDPNMNQLNMFVEHSSFDLVEFGNPVPFQTITFHNREVNYDDC